MPDNAWMTFAEQGAHPLEPDDAAASVAAIGRIPSIGTILDVVCKATGMRFAAVARVTESRWTACSVRDEVDFGLVPGSELDISTTFCDSIRRSGQPVIIDAVATDPVYSGHLTPAQYGFQSYISVPIIRADGAVFGTLCALDAAPAKVNRPEIVGMFHLFAELIASNLDTQDRLAESEAALAREMANKQLREQFIAVLGHDLRGPLAAIASSTRLLEDPPPEIEPSMLFEAIDASVRRMDELIRHILDFARERLGGGIPLDRDAGIALQPMLEAVIAEQQVVAGDRAIEAEFALHEPVAADAWRVAQLFANLLSNALAYSPPGSPVRVRAATVAGMFELSVANSGAPIAPETMQRLFEPFFRAADRADRQGLGLGLFVAAAVARAHGGAIEAVSDSTETRFTFRMPVARAFNAAA